MEGAGLMEDAQLTIFCTDNGTHAYAELAVLVWDEATGLVGSAARRPGRPMADVTPLQPVTVHGKPAQSTTGKLRIQCRRGHHRLDIPLRQETAVRLFENAEKCGVFAVGRAARIEASLAARLVNV